MKDKGRRGRGRVKGYLGTWLRMAGLIILVLAASLLAENITPLKDFERYLAEYPGTARGLTILTVGAAVTGALLLVGAQFVVRAGDERDLSRREVEELASHRRNRSLYRFRGRTIGRGFNDEVSFKEIKAAWRQRAWRTSPRWQRFFLMAAGAVFLIVGMFGFFIVVGPPVVKLLCLTALTYAAVRTAWQFWHA